MKVFILMILMSLTLTAEEPVKKDCYEALNTCREACHVKKNAPDCILKCYEKAYECEEKNKDKDK